MPDPYIMQPVFSVPTPAEIPDNAFYNDPYQDARFLWLAGINSPNDGLGGLFIWRQLSNLTPDGINVFLGHPDRPNGRFIRASYLAPAGRRIETYQGETNASGQYTVTFPVPFVGIPVITVQPTAVGTHETTVTLATASGMTTGFTVTVANRQPVTLLGLGLVVLSMNTAPVANLPVSVVVTEHQT